MEALWDLQVVTKFKVAMFLMKEEEVFMEWVIIIQEARREVFMEGVIIIQEARWEVFMEGVIIIQEARWEVEMGIIQAKVAILVEAGMFKRAITITDIKYMWY